MRNGRDKGRAGVYFLAGVYILYLAYNIFKDVTQSSSDAGIAIKAAMVAFVVIGIGLVVLSIKMFRDALRSEDSEEPSEQDSLGDGPDTEK